MVTRFLVALCLLVLIGPHTSALANGLGGQLTDLGSDVSDDPQPPKTGAPRLAPQGPELAPEERALRVLALERQRAEAQRQLRLMTDGVPEGTVERVDRRLKQRLQVDRHRPAAQRHEVLEVEVRSAEDVQKAQQRSHVLAVVAAAIHGH